jgi:ATP-binding cassette subfamily C (CFTR/MRP) protein 4
VLFSGTLRSNMDPWSAHSDARLWQVLRAVQLSTAVRKLGGLDARMAEAGNNLSVGQRQLFCLARSDLDHCLYCSAVLPVFACVILWIL